VQPGACLGDRFVLEHLAGSGGMGVVYRAEDRLSGEPVAIKLLLDPAQNEARFEREARALADLSHPAIVRYVAHGTVEARPWLAMEWLDGEDLGSVLRKGPLSIADATGVVRRIAEGLGAAHRRGVVHRDIKPSNVFVCGGDLERVRILDFGIARVGGAASAVTRSGVVMGSPGYLAPEQARGSRDLDARADVFSLGCVLFACLTGRAPFVAADIVATLAKVLFEEPPRLCDAWPDAPKALDDLVARLMAPNPEARPKDGVAAAAELESIIKLSGTFGSTSHRAAFAAEERRLVCAVVLGPRRTVESDATTVISTTTVIDRVTVDASQVAEITRRHGGRLETTRGGSLVVLLDEASLATDRAERAVRCAESLRTNVGERQIVVVTIRASAGGSTLADQLATSAKPLFGSANAGNGVLVDQGTRGLLGERFALGRAGSGWAVLAERAGGSDHPLLGQATPCVGRDREVGALLALFDESVSEPVARAAVLVGPPGIGKSRVRAELLRRLRARGDTLSVWTCRGDAVSAGTPLGLLAQMIRDAASISGAEALDERRAKLRALTDALVASADRDRVSCFLGEIAGAPFPEEGEDFLAAARRDPVLYGDQTRRAFEDLACAAATKTPLVLVVEDVQWGDSPSVRAIDGVLRNSADAAVLVVATARPEVAEVFPQLWHDRGAQEIRLGALTPKASERLVRAALGADADPERVARAVARGGGHPLHLEEIVRTMEAGQTEELPETVAALVESRIQSIEPESRRILRAGSIFGRAFWTRGVASMLGVSVEETARWVRELCEREWITARAVSRFSGEQELAFCQDVVREVAYATLTDADRTVGHRICGEFLESVGEASALVIARHFELGGDAERASTFFARAAEQAMDGNDYNGVLSHVTRALELAGPSASAAPLRALAAEAHGHLGEHDAARTTAFRALATLEASDPRWLQAAGVAIASAGKLGDHFSVEQVATLLLDLDEPLARGPAFAHATANAVVQLYLGGRAPLGDRVFERLERAGDEPMVRAQIKRAAGIRALFAGDPAKTVALLRDAVAASESAGDLRLACSLRKTQGYYEAECGAIEEGVRTLRACVATASRLGLLGLEAHAKQDLGYPLIRLGRLDEAEQTQRDALTELDKQGDRRLLSFTHGYLSWIYRLRGDHPSAETEARLALELAPSPPVKLMAFGHLAAALFAMGNVDEAAAMAEAGIQVLREIGPGEEGAPLVLLLAAQTRSARDDRDGAHAIIREARDDVLARAARISDPSLRAAFLTRFAENVEILALARAWLGE
jgi:tetratricopeptide (TPR) repeat protein